MATTLFANVEHPHMQDKRHTQSDLACEYGHVVFGECSICVGIFLLLCCLRAQDEINLLQYSDSEQRAIRIAILIKVTFLIMIISKWQPSKWKRQPTENRRKLKIKSYLSLWLGHSLVSQVFCFARRLFSPNGECNSWVREYEHCQRNDELQY